MRKVPPLVAVLLLAIISWSGCAVDAAAKKEEKELWKASRWSWSRR